MEPIPPRCANEGLEAFSGAHNFSVHDMRFTHAHNLHKHKYVIYNSSGQFLELFRLLNPIKDASHKRNRQLSPPDSHCLQGTREQVFSEVRSWVNDQAGWKPSPPPGSDEEHKTVAVKHICWLYGFVGCGKSAIAQNIAEEYARKNRLAVSFFFFRNAGDRSTIDRFAASLAHQISLSVPGAKKIIEHAIIEDPSLIEPTCSLEYQLEHLVFGPLLVALEASGISADDPFLLLVDGMDECNDKEGISTFIDVSIEFFSRNPTIPLRLLITSRIEEHIQTRIEDGLPSIHLIDLVSRSSRADVMSFMKAVFEKTRKHDRALRALGDTWPEPQDMDQLVDYCDGSFIFASTIARFILGGSGRRDPRNPMERLPLALKINPGLDGVYVEVLSRAQHLPHFQVIISTVASVQTPISIKAMSTLLDLSTYEIIRVLVVLQAILQVPGRDDVPVSLFHTSFRDFLIDESRSGNFHTPPTHHTFLMYRCLDLLFGKKLATHDECCRYAIVYWPLHLQIAARTDPSFDLDSVTEHPYHSLHADDYLTSEFEATWAKRRPLTLGLSEGEWYAMLSNAKKADIAIHGREDTDDPVSISSSYYHDQTDKSQWILVRTDGYGRSCPPIVRVDSSRACTIRDMVQGLCTLMSSINRMSWSLYLGIRLSEDIAINLEFQRRDSPTASADEKRYTPGGSRVVISGDLSVGLHADIR